MGDTLSDRGLAVTLVRVAREVPRRRGRDLSGLATPAPGTRFVGVDVRACNEDGGPAIGPYSFKLELSGGGEGRLRFPQRVLEDDFETVRTGCERGWIVFEVPHGESAEALRFRFDDTASAAPSRRREKHSRFRWDVSPG